MVRNNSWTVQGFRVAKRHRNSRRKCHIFELQGDDEEHSGHNWKELENPLSTRWRIESSTATEGKVHWFAWSGEPFQVIILSIDILTDELRALVSITLSPEIDLFTWNHTFYCRQQGRLWALENFDNPTWVETERLLVSPLVCIDITTICSSWGCQVGCRLQQLESCCCGRGYWFRISQLCNKLECRKGCPSCQQSGRFRLTEVLRLQCFAPFFT